MLRSGSNKYYLKLKNGVSVAVCKKHFLQTFSVSDGRVSRARKKVCEGKSPGEALRSARGCRARKIFSSDMEFVSDHIRSFLAYQSHYTSKHNDNRNYLCESLNLRQMYTLYIEKCTAVNRIPVKEHDYRYLFNTKFNRHFYVPKNDSCKTCDILK